MKKLVLFFVLTIQFCLSSLNAAIVCPPDISIYCNDDRHYTPLTGMPTVFGYPIEFVAYTDIALVSGCNSGTFDRIWYLDLNQDGIFQSSEHNCGQRITVLSKEGTFDVTYPADKIYGCKDAIIMEKPEWTSGPCDMIAVSTKDAIYDSGNASCYKILRTFTIINWCAYRPSDPNWNGQGIWTHTQNIKVVETSPPVIKECKNLIIPIDTDCQAEFTIKNSAIDEVTCQSELLSWEVEIDLWSDGNIDYKYGYNEKDKFRINPVKNGQEISITLPVKVRQGHHKVRWWVKDQCGNHKSCDVKVEVRDTKNPTPYVHELLSASFDATMMNLMVTARIFNVGSYDNCTFQKDLKFSFSKNVNDTIRVINCNNAGFQFFTIYITDHAGNQEEVDVFMLAFDNGTCPGPRGVLRGNVQRSNRLLLKDINFQLKRGEENITSTFSKEEGSFCYQDINIFNDYVIKPQYEIAISDALDIADLKKMQNYFFGIDTLVNFEYVAADINEDRKINTKDLVQLRNLILNPNENNNNWVFLSDVDTVKNVLDIKMYKDQFSMMDFDGNIDFTAVYKGDITDANKENVTSRNTMSYYITDNDQSFDVYLDADDVAVEGLQFDIVSSLASDWSSLSSKYFELNLDAISNNGTLSSIAFLNDFTYEKNTPLFSIAKKSKKDQFELINGKVLFPSYRIQKMKLLDIDKNQNIVIFPNPSKGLLTITIPENGKINQLVDVYGNKITFEYINNTLSFEAPAGMYYLQVAIDGKTTTKKVVRR